MVKINSVLRLLDQRYKAGDTKDARINNNKDTIILAQRLGITDKSGREAIDEIEKKIPPRYYGLVNALFPKYVNDICSVKVPKCSDCFILYHCDKVGTMQNYHNKFNCTKCGYCCTLIINLSKRDIKRIIDQGFKREDFVDFHENMKLIDDQCVFLYKEGSKYLCGIYEYRPNICRVYPSYGPEIKDCKEHKRLKILHKLP